MSTMLEALQDVGYKPTIRPSDVRRQQERQATTDALAQALDGVIDPLIMNPRRVEVQRAGGFYRARYEGYENSVFGDNPKQAIERLRLWGLETYNHKPREVVNE
jgi:hypothetical protein